MKKPHPDAPTPQVYRTDAYFDTIRSLRERNGDRFIIDGLAPSEATGGDEDDEWGEAFAWQPELLDTALAAEEVHESGQALNLVSPSTPAEPRARLVEDANAHPLPGFTRNAAEDEHGFVSLDAGLCLPRAARCRPARWNWTTWVHWRTRPSSLPYCTAVRSGSSSVTPDGRSSSWEPPCVNGK